MKILIVVFLLCFFGASKAADSDVLLLLTEFNSSKYLKNKSYMTKEGGTVLVPSTLSMTFDVLKVLQSEAEFGEQKLTFPMDVETDYPFTIAGGVVLVVRKTNKKHYELLDWDFVRSAVCLDKQFIPKDYEKLYFEMPWKSKKGKLCRFISTNNRNLNNID